MEYNENKIVIFDWGGIVESHKKEENNYFKIIVNIIKSINPDINENEVISLWKKCTYDKDGKSISTCKEIKDVEKWFSRIKEVYKLKCNFTTFRNIYRKEFENVDYYKDMVKLEHETKRRCKIGILSNLTLLDKERLDKQLDLNKFDYIWLSFELGEIKPNSKIYEIVEKDCEIAPKNILFIDDRKENVIAAQKRGWNICNYSGYEIDKIKDKIEEFIVNNK